jgi:serine/threonine protein kinase
MHEMMVLEQAYHGRGESSTAFGPAETLGPGPAPPASARPAIARYEILGELGRGGMGEVFRGRDIDLGREIAFKVLRKQHREHPRLARRFVEEAQIGGQLVHPGIVPIYELGNLADGRPFFTMKLVEGRTLHDLLAARPTASEERAGRGSADPAQTPTEGLPSPHDDLPRLLAIFEQVCQTMAYAHARGVIHRDLKPSNIMVGGFGEVQVMDWGLAKVLPRGGEANREKARSELAASVIRTVRSTSPADASQAGSVLGTPAYMCPEQASGDIEAIDERADVFGLGSILCEILTGQPAYAGPSPDAILRKALRGETADALRRIETCGADDELCGLTRRCLSVRPEERPRQAGAIAAAVTAHQRGVQERLRQAELDRVEAEARAEEEVKRRALADDLAREAQSRAGEEAKGRELADRLAGEAQARAVEERRRRRMTAALAASIIILLVGAGGGWYGNELQQQARRQEGENRAVRVDLGLREAEVLRSEAERSGGDRSRWQAARDARRRSAGGRGAGRADPAPDRRAGASGDGGSGGGRGGPQAAGSGGGHPLG